MARSDDMLKLMARRAYERGRLVRAAKIGLIPIPLIAISSATCGAPWSTCLAGALLIIATFFFAWRGRTLEAAIAPGFMSGLGAFTLPFVGEAIGLCNTGGPMAGPLICFFGGVVAGGILGARVLREVADRPMLLAAGSLIAVLVGALGCVLAGLGGVAGMLLGVALTLVPVLLLRSPAS